MTEKRKNQGRGGHRIVSAHGIWLTAALLLYILLTGCSAARPAEETESEEPTEAEQVFLLKAGSTILPQSHDYQALASLKEAIEQRSGNTIEVQVYPGSSLGTSEVLLAGMQTGTVEMAVLPLSGLAHLYPELETELAPFQGKGEEELKARISSDRFRKKLDQLREETGIRVLALSLQGSRSVWTKKEIHALADLNGLRLYVQNTPSTLKIFRSLGVQPAGNDESQIYDALKTGLLDGAEIGLVYADELRLYESCHYCLETRHAEGILAVMISEEIFASMEESQRQIVMQSAEEIAGKLEESTLSREREIREKLEEEGVIFTAQP